MANVKLSTWKKIRKGSNGLQVRVREFVRKLRPERVRWQLRHLLASVDQHWSLDSSTPFPSNPASTVHESVGVECEQPESCREPSPDRPMSSQVAQVTLSEEERSRNGSVRPNELSLVVGGGLAPPSPSHTPRNKSPVTVQEWVDSLPLTPTDVTKGEDESEPRIILPQDNVDNLTLGAEAGLMCGPLPPAVQVTSCREPSESGSHCSSVESLLEARKPDPEEVLLSLGFGGIHSDECRIPQRFLQPSRLRGVAIDDFLRHQQEVVQNFETGFCGYRGLSGPSHAMPSVIVAKIMEKLREHERESSLAASPPHVSTNTDRNKFSRVARNVLTKIKCVPGSSVLTPDNRKWLDSQGHKSPEISRKRIIIGHQSFTFGHDGDLIESQSPPSSLTDSDSRWTSSTGTPGHQKADLSLDRPAFPSIQEDLTEPPLPSPPPLQAKHGFANVVATLMAEKNQGSKLSSSSMDVSEEDKVWSRSLGDSGLPSSGRSSRGLEDCDSPVNLAEDKASDPNSHHTADGKDLFSKHALETVNSPLSLTSSTELNEFSTKSNDGTGNPSNLVFKTIEGNSDLISDLNDSSRPTVFNLQFENILNSDSILKSDNQHDIFCDERVNRVINASTSSVSFNKSSDQTEDSLESPQDCKNRHKLILDKEGTNLDDNPAGSVYSSLPSSEMSTTLVTSPWPSLASELENVSLTEEKQSLDSTMAVVNEDTNVDSSVLPKLTTSKVETPLTAPVRVIESLDKVIESLEKIMEPLEVIAESELQLSTVGKLQSNRASLLCSYEDVRLLAEQLLKVGVSLDVGSPEQFLFLTVEERCALQCRVLRQALSTYQAQLAADTSHYQLRSCVGLEALRLSDLLDTATDPDKLSTLVQQMTELLKHQAELSEQLKGSATHEPHQLCEVVLRRLHSLELVVQKNTQALSELRGHL